MRKTSIHHIVSTYNDGFLLFIIYFMCFFLSRRWLLLSRKQEKNKICDIKETDKILKEKSPDIFNNDDDLYKPIL